MKRFISYNKIGDFNKVIKDVGHSARYLGYDEVKKEVIYDNLAPLPTIMITGSEKVHGTNAAVCMGGGEFWVQSRKNIINLDKDNAFCAATILTKDGTQKSWENIINSLSKEYNIDLDTNIISVYFEWSGGNIQKKAAVSGLDKRAIIFQHFKVSPLNPIIDEDGTEKSAYWLETSETFDMSGNGLDEISWLDDTTVKIYNVMNFDTWNFEVDFNKPKLSQNDFIKLVEEIIEPNSPLGKSMGIENNVGEGVVFTFIYKETLHKFKVKGEEHSVSKVKTLKPVDNVREQAKQEEAQRVCPAWRLEQGYKEVFGDKPGDKKRTGDFMKWMSKDIIMEETANIVDNGFEVKEIMAVVNKIAKNWFFEELNKEVGL